MKGEHITRPEFDLYVKMTAESMASIAESTKESAKESRESNQILREYIITNNNKHEKTSDQIVDIKQQLKKVKEVVEANSKVTQVAKWIKWVLGAVSLGFLTALGVALFKYLS